MTEIHCPRCQVRIAVMPHIGDFVHSCNSNSATLNNEDIVRMGGFIDYTGSEAKGNRNILLQGAENKIAGTRAAIEGEKVHAYTSRGARTSTHRTRQHEEYILTDGNI